MTSFEEIQDKGLLAAKGLHSLLMETAAKYGTPFLKTASLAGSSLNNLLLEKNDLEPTQAPTQAPIQAPTEVSAEVPIENEEKPVVGSGLSSLLEGFKKLDPYTRAEIGGLVGQVIGEALTGREAPKMAQTIRQIPVALRERKEKQQEKQIEKLKLLRETQKQSRDYGLKFKYNFLKDKSIQKSQQALDAASSVKALLETKNPISDQAMRIQFPRLLGEVGNLTAQEQNAFGGSKAIVEKMKQLFNTWTTGELTPTNKEFLGELVSTLEIAASRNYNKRANDLIESEVAAGQGYIDKDYLNFIINPFLKGNNDASTTDPTDSRDPIDPNDPMAIRTVKVNI